jgi:N-acetyl-anhydromuramyl-L-alanine amidase AmpD
MYRYICWGILVMMTGAIIVNVPFVAAQARQLYDCKTDSASGYTLFDADYTGVDQVCPAYAKNFSTTGMASTGVLYVVIHNTGNKDAAAILGNIRQFQDPAKRVSAHYIVGLDSDGIARIIQIVSEKNMAYHAGAANRTLDGKTIDNTNSIGIEVVGIGDLNGWPSDAVYTAVANLVKDIVRRGKANGRTIELNRDYIVGHEEINNDGKYDPGQQWDWNRFMVDYLGGTYKPAMEIIANLDAPSREVSLQLVTRANGRTGLHFELRQDDGDYTTDLEPLNDVSRTWSDNPATINLPADRLPEVAIPAQFCYRAWAARSGIDYVNPSRDDCVQQGTVDAYLVSLNEHLILKPGETAEYEVELQNTGTLPWVPDVPYGVREVDGDQLSVARWATLGKTVASGERIKIIIPITAPNTPGDYHATWQIGYVEPSTGDAVVFGTAIPIDLTVRSKGLGDIGSELGQIISDFIQSLRQGLEQTVQDLLRQVEAALVDALNDLWTRLRQELARTLPCLFTPALIGYTGLALSQRRKRLK